MAAYTGAPRGRRDRRPAVLAVVVSRIEEAATRVGSPRSEGAGATSAGGRSGESPFGSAAQPLAARGNVKPSSKAGIRRKAVIVRSLCGFLPDVQLVFTQSAKPDPWCGPLTRRKNRSFRAGDLRTRFSIVSGRQVHSDSAALPATWNTSLTVCVVTANRWRFSRALRSSDSAIPIDARRRAEQLLCRLATAL